MGVQEGCSLGSQSGSPAIATPSLVDVRTKQSVAAEVNMSAIGSPPEPLAYPGYSHSDSLRLRSPESPGLRRLPDPEHLCGADWAYSLRGWTSILHRDGLGVTHLPLGPALHTISFHGIPPNL